MPSDPKSYFITLHGNSDDYGRLPTKFKVYGVREASRPSFNASDLRSAVEHAGTEPVILVEFFPHTELADIVEWHGPILLLADEAVSTRYQCDLNDLVRRACVRAVAAHVADESLEGLDWIV
jgi:hypothetical protein